MHIITAILFLGTLTSLAYGLKLNEKDYIITGFGMKEGNPFITVQGTAGGSYDPSMGDEGYEAYVFNTDKGIFQIRSPKVVQISRIIQWIISCPRK